METLNCKYQPTVERTRSIVTAQATEHGIVMRSMLLVMVVLCVALLGCDQSNNATVSNIVVERQQRPHYTGAKTAWTDSERTAGLGDDELVEQASDRDLSARLRRPPERASQLMEPRRQMTRSNQDRPPILEVVTNTGRFHGVPIGLFSDQTLLMRNDGAIQFLDNTTILSRDKLEQRFLSIDPVLLSQQLRKEFGGRYQVRFDPPYVIVAPPQGLESWLQRFKSFQHSLQLYCATVGIPLRATEFPMTAVIFANKTEFLTYSRSIRDEMPENCVGYYSPKTNRIVLYQSGTADDQATMETICHEATHQLAFNLGIHQRMAENPLWLVEGLAMMFEGKRFSDLKSRDTSTYWPSTQAQAWKKLSRDPARVKQIIDRLIRSDEPFKTDTLDAYSVAWGMSIYFSQRYRTQYTNYIRQLSQLPPFETYDSQRRTADFFHSFGSDTSMIARNILKHIENLP